MREITDNTVAVCMATYNGEKYIRQQIESVLRQSYQDFVLFAHDDGSTDSTADILKEYEDDERFVLLDGLKTGNGAKDNFAVILSHVKRNFSFSYFMFCDQDDVWLEDKIKICVSRVKKIEKKKGRGEPILAHSDLRVVDENLNVLGESFIRYRALNPGVRDVNHLLAQNNITGCAMIWNKALNDLIDLGSPEAAMHDWWFSLCASLFGTISFVDEPTILYRQHGKNTVGATKVNTPGFIIMRLLGNNHVKQTIHLSVKQARGLLGCYGDRIGEAEKKSLRLYGNLYEYGKLRRMAILIRHGYLKQGIVQIIGQLMYV